MSADSVSDAHRDDTGDPVADQTPFTYRHPRDLDRTETRPGRDLELEFYGWVLVSGRADDDQPKTPTGGGKFGAGGTGTGTAGDGAEAERTAESGNGQGKTPAAGGKFGAAGTETGTAGDGAEAERTAQGPRPDGSDASSRAVGEGDAGFDADGVNDQAPADVPPSSGTPALHPARPHNGASRAAWADYAKGSRGATDDDLAGLNRDGLVERYGD